MQWLRWTVVALSLIEAGWMTFDGMRALVVGDYVTPRTGDYAGQLGPWTKLVTAAGIEPRSTFMKAGFVIYSAAWLIATVCFALGREWEAWTMLAGAVGTLWYLWMGTITSVIIIILLVVGMISGRV